MAAFATANVHTVLRCYMLAIALVTGLAAAQINHEAGAYVVQIYNGASAGPDGPWWYIRQAIDYPDQITQMMPSITEYTLAINSSACNTQGATCPLPLPTLWSSTGAYRVTDGPARESAPMDGSGWDSDYATLLDLKGDGGFFTTRLTLHYDGQDSSPAFLDQHGLAISQNYSVSFPGGAEYTMDRGFLSLYGGEQDMTYQNATGFTVTTNHTLQNAYLGGKIPSLSYGLHLGSVSPNVTGSLTLGGYDASRVLATPIVSSSTTHDFALVDIALNVSSGDFAYYNTSSAYNPGLLRENGGEVNSVQVHPRPGVPYLYLPRDTCDAIAAHLPVTYDSDFNLYFWDTDRPAYKDIVSSPSYLAFTFASDNGDQGTINIPFALLNLTLETPLISTPTQYFPCSPFKPGQTGYTLGNAFLQGAFLGQHWQTGKMFLSQAPGPEFMSRNLQKMVYTDTAITPAVNPPSWESSWSSSLTALPRKKQGGGNADNNGQSNTSNKSEKESSLSTGAIAGIAVIGAVAIIALLAVLLWFLRRRKRSVNLAVKYYGHDEVKSAADQSSYSPIPAGQAHLAEFPHLGERHEMEVKPQLHEMGGQREIGELQGDEPNGMVKSGR